MAHCVFCDAELMDPDRCGGCRRGQPVFADPVEQEAARGDRTPARPLEWNNIVFLVGLVLVAAWPLLPVLLWPGVVMVVFAFWGYLQDIKERLAALSG